MLMKYETVLWLGTWLQVKAELDIAAEKDIYADEYAGELADHPGLLEVLRSAPLYAPEIMKAFRAGKLSTRLTYPGIRQALGGDTQWSHIAQQHPAETDVIANAIRLMERLRDQGDDGIKRYIAHNPELNRLHEAICTLPCRVCPICGGIRMLDTRPVRPLAAEYLAFDLSDGLIVLDPLTAPAQLDFGWVCDSCGFEEAEEPEEPERHWYRWDSDMPAPARGLFERFEAISEIIAVRRPPKEEWYVLVGGRWYGTAREKLVNRLSFGT